MNTLHKKITLFFILAISLSVAQQTFAEPEYEIVITDISYQEVHKNWLFIPTAVDLQLEWTISIKEVVNNRERLIYKAPEDLPFSYRVYIYHGDTNSEPVIREVSNLNYLEVPDVEMGTQLAFKVRAFEGDEANLVSESEMASIVVGKGASGSAIYGESWLYYLHPGRWQLASLGKAEIYDKSTTLGKVAFIFLSVTGFLSLLILIFYSSRTLYLGNIFPFKRSARGLFWSFTGSCDKSYENRLTNKFKFILKAWETIATKSRFVADKAVKNIPTSLSSTEKMASVDVACLEYWTSDGDRAISTIEDIIAFPNHSQYNGQRNPDDLLTELVIKIEDSFHDLIYSKNGQNGSNGGLDIPEFEKENMEALIDEIYEPVVVDEKPLTRLRKWVLRKGIFDLDKGLRPFPTSRIIKAGLEIHRMNGYRWLKPTEEVKRAFEDRASTEIETLKRKSRIEWFWNYGALAPLVGLFGTVTGITYAFQQLSTTNVTPDFVTTIHNLSNGIFEALWTTIFGLANGIVFIIVYYYFKHKLDWIYSKWEEIYVSITEKL